MKKEITTNNFKVGERVEAEWFGEWLKGTIIEHDPAKDILEYRVLLDTIGAHCFSGRFMMRIQDNKQQSKIVITTDGTTTTATHYDGKQNVKSATAKCAADDTFNFNTGAQLAFNRLMYGTDYNPADVALKQKDDKSTPAPETVRLWCAKDEVPGKYLTRGKIYTRTNNIITYDDGWTCEFDQEYFEESGLSDHDILFPLLHRPAKEGEWIICSSSESCEALDYKDVPVKVCSVYPMGVFAEFPNGQHGAFHEEYEVIDGYHGEYEQPEELLQGAAVMTGNTSEFIKGKKYMFVDGRVKDETGQLRPSTNKPVRSFDDNWVVNMGFIRLIEDEGEK